MIVTRRSKSATTRRSPRQHPQTTTRAGLGWLDLVIGVLIVGLLMSLSVAALPMVREVARNRQCRSNLARIGVALQAYHDVHGTLPPAAFWETSELQIGHPLLGDTKLDRDSIRAIRQNWLTLLLPHLGEKRLATEFHGDRSIADSTNEGPRTAALAAAGCPDDDWNRPDNPYIVTFSDGRTAAFARGNYAINGGSHALWMFPGFLSEPAPNGHHMTYDPKAPLFQWWGAGIAGFNRCFSYGEIVNGLATTVGVDEIRAGIAPQDPRGAWALGRIGSSVTWAHGVNGDDCGPNNQADDSDDILMGTEVHPIIGDDLIRDAEMPFCDHCNDGIQATSRSRHPGGVNTLMLDGSVRFVSDDVDGGLWHAMHSRETPSDVLTDDSRSTRKEGAPPDEPADSTGKELPQRGERAPDQIVNSVGMRFQRIPAGEFVMGLPDKDDTYPYPKASKPHKVVLSKPFHLGIHEVTQTQYQRVMGNNPSWYAPKGGGRAELKVADTGRCPVESVTWNEAAEFCRRLANLPEERAAGRSYRLPTEAEWEYACRSGSSEPYLFASFPDAARKTGIIAGMQGESDVLRISPVGSFPPNKFGLHDMCGNVFEWVADWYDRDYYGQSPLHDPPGPSHGYLKVIRGWYWRYFGVHCKWEYLVSAPWQKSRFIGFRVVCTTPDS